MASFFRTRREGPSLSSPTPPLSLDAPATNSSSPRWLSGLISGAGKLISTVLGSSEESDDEFDDGDDDDIILSSDEKKEDGGPHKNLQESNQGKIAGVIEESPKSEYKVVIQKLVTQETFSREESDKLIKIIQSRVVESSSSPSPAVETMNRNQIDHHTPYSLSLSPLQASPELCNAAVTEAKKWLEEKRESLRSRKNEDFGPCTLNTDMTRYGFEGDIGSPVDLAKSYMQSKPPWQSPFLSGAHSYTAFNTPPAQSGARNNYFDEIYLGKFNYSLPSSKVLKRDYVSTGMWDPMEESSRKVRSRPSGSFLDSQISPNSRIFESDFSGTFRKENSKQSVPDAIAELSQSKETGSTAQLNQDDLFLKSGMSEPVVPIERNENNGVTEILEADKQDVSFNMAHESPPVDNHAEDPAVSAKETEKSKEESLRQEPVMPSGNENVEATQVQAVTDNSLNLNKDLDLNEKFPLSDSRKSDMNLQITNSLNGSTNKNSANGLAGQSNVESEFESSTNGAQGISDISEGAHRKPHKTANINNNTTKTLDSSDTGNVRRGRKRVSGRGRGRGGK